MDAKRDREFRTKNDVAKYNIKNGKDYICPVCDCTVSKHRDECHFCEYDPLGRNRMIKRGEKSYAREVLEDTSMVGSFFFFWFTFIAPISYLLSAVSEDPTDNFFGIILLIPNAIMVLSTVVSIINMARGKNEVGCLSGPIRIWVLVFSVLALIKNIQFFA